MSENTSIEWADHTFNPWEGCQKVGPGCDHCYAETRNARFAGGSAVNWGPGAPRRRTGAANWKKPIAWNAAAAEFQAAHGRRQRVFCASLADVFDNAVDPAWRLDLLELIAKTPNLDWLLLTKRIGNAHAMLDAALEVMSHGLTEWAEVPWPNVWIGATIVNQEEADRDIPKLLAVPAARRFLSMEPLLASVDLTGICRPWGDHGASAALLSRIHWVIVGGESGPSARPMHPEWARDLRDQCAAAGVPFLFKQWGEWAPGECAENTLTMRAVQVADLSLNGEWRYETIAGNSEFHRDDEPTMYRAGKKAAGRWLDGVQHDGFPVAP